MGTYIDNIREGDPQTVAQLAVSYPAALAVFTKYNIDYCCGGHRSIEDACRRVGVDPDKIKAEIFQSLTGDSSQTFRPQNWTSTFLVDYIIQNHHSYVKEAIPEVQALLDKLCDAHGNDCPELWQIREKFDDLAEELMSHMEKEEVVIFPAIKRLDRQKSEDHPLTSSIQGPVRAMEHEHLIAGDLVKQIRAFSGNYNPPEFACPTFLITYKKLREFDSDLMTHIHLENNVLFERVRQKPTAGGSSAFNV